MKKTAISRKLFGFTVATAIAISATTATAYAADLSAGEPQSIGLLLPAVQKVREATARGSVVDLDMSSGGESTEGRIVFTTVVVTS